MPLLMSLFALLIASGHVAISGNVHDVDEGFDAHMFQLIMVAQLPLIAYFAYRWLPRAPRSPTTTRKTAASATRTSIEGPAPTSARPCA